MSTMTLFLPQDGQDLLSTSHSSLYPGHWTQDLAYCWYSRHACRIIRWSLALKSPENLSLIVTWRFSGIKMWASASSAVIATAGHDSNVRSHTTSTVRSLDRKLPRGMPTGSLLNLLTLILSIQSSYALNPRATGNAIFTSDGRKWLHMDFPLDDVVDDSVPKFGRRTSEESKVKQLQSICFKLAW